LIFFYPAEVLRHRKENFKEGRLNQYLYPDLATRLEAVFAPVVLRLPGHAGDHPAFLFKLVNR